MMLEALRVAGHAANAWRTQAALASQARRICSSATAYAPAAEAAAVAADTAQTRAGRSETDDRLSLLHLYRYAAHPSPSTLQAGAARLQQELPLRLNNLLGFLAAKQLPANLHAPRQATVDTLTQLQHNWQKQYFEPGSAASSIDAFAAAVHRHRAQLDATMQHVCGTYQMLAHTEEWWQCPEHAAAAAQLLDHCHYWAVGARLAMAQHLAAWARLSGDPALKLEHPNLVHPRCHVLRLLQHTVEDCRAFCVEKNGCAPEVDVEGSPQLSVVAVDSYVQFIVVEVLKNAMQAVLDRYGAWDVDEAEPVVVQVGVCPQDPRYYTIRVHDTGGGVPEHYLGKMMLYYGTSAVKERSVPGYGYSREHGSPFKGIGVGVPMSRVYAHFMGGSVTWCVDRDAGATMVQLRLPRAGCLL